MSVSLLAWIGQYYLFVVLIYVTIFCLQILADAMGLGKTVMTIALILARPGRGNPEIEDDLATDVNGNKPKGKESHKALTCVKAKGGTLIICPMALLSQWKVFLL